MITLGNLKKTIADRQVLKGVTFKAFPGELITLIGASGSGKTTLFRCLTLKEKWEDGYYIYDGVDMLAPNGKGKQRIRKEWAYIEESPILNSNKTAVKNVLEGRFYHTPLWRFLTGAATTDEHVRAMDYLEKVGLLDKGHLKVGQLSGGEKQRVAIAKALGKDVKVIIADEPVSGLDPASSKMIMQDLKNICEQHGLIIICSLHNVELAEKYASRIIGLSDGRIAVDISGRRLLQKEKELIL